MLAVAMETGVITTLLKIPEVQTRNFIVVWLLCHGLYSKAE